MRRVERRRGRLARALWQLLDAVDLAGAAAAAGIPTTEAEVSAWTDREMMMYGDDPLPQWMLETLARIEAATAAQAPAQG